MGDGLMVALGRPEGMAPGHTERALAYPFLTAAPSTRIARFWPQDGAWIDQGDTGTCVAATCSHRIADRPWPQLSGQVNREWAYDLYVKATGDTSMQEGTWAHVVAEELLRRNLITRFEWLLTPEGIDFALKERGSVAYGIPWYNSMFEPEMRSDGHLWLRVDEGSGLAGGHEVLANGIRVARGSGTFLEPFDRIKNSWGRGWGENGTVRLSHADRNRLIFDTWGDAVLLKEPGA